MGKLLHGKRVLVVNDVPSTSEAIQRQLGRLGCETLRTASDGFSALSVLMEVPFDLVLCDIHMPGLDGFQLCRIMRTITSLRAIPVVLVSATYRDFVARRLARDVAAQAFVEWPCSAPLMEATLQEALTDLDREGTDARILVADDDEAVRRAVVRVLRDGLLEAREASDGLEAIDIAREWEPDLVLCDYAMPKAGGRDVLQWFGQARPETPVIVFTAYGSEELAVELMKLGAYDYLTKPLRMKSIVPMCRSALERQNLRVVTQRFEQLVQQLQRAERSWVRTFSAVQELIFVVDAEGMIQQANPSANRLLARTVGTKQRLADLLWRDTPPDPDPIAAARESGQPFTAEGPLPGLGGGLYRFTASPLWSDLGNYEGAALVARDISSERQRQRQALITEKMATIGRLAAGIAHEINNPAAYVLLNLERSAELLKELAPKVVNSTPADLPEAGSPQSPAMAVEELLAMIPESIEGIERIRKLTQELRVFAPYPEGRWQNFDLNDAIEVALAMTRSELWQRAQITRRRGKPPTCCGDPSQIAQVTAAILINAADAIDPGEPADNSISIATSEKDGQAVLEVSDTGCGIPDELLPQLFEPFFTTKQRSQSTGLGLSIAYEVVQRHGGEIQVESAVGKGSTFRVILPPSRQRDPDAEEQPEWIPRSPAPRVLLIDDESAVRRAVRRILAGAELEEAASGEQALEILERNQEWDVVLCDVSMPGLSGITLHSLVSERWPELVSAFVFVTGGARSAENAEALERLGSPVVNKPLTATELRELIVHTCGKPLAR